MWCWATLALDLRTKQWEIDLIDDDDPGVEEKIDEVTDCLGAIALKVLGHMGIFQVTGEILKLESVGGELAQCKESFFRCLREKGLEVELDLHSSTRLGPLLACVRKVEKVRFTPFGLTEAAAFEKILERQREAFREKGVETMRAQFVHLNEIQELGALHPRFYPEFRWLCVMEREIREIEMLLVKPAFPQKKPKEKPVDPDSYFAWGNPTTAS